MLAQKKNAATMQTGQSNKHNQFSVEQTTEQNQEPQ